MQLSLALLTGFALTGTSFAAPEPRPLSFVTFPCKNCALDGPPSCGQAQQDYQVQLSETCYPLRNGNGQASIRVGYSLRPSCYVSLFSNGDCTGDFYNYFNVNGVCQEIPNANRQSYKVFCSA